MFVLHFRRQMDQGLELDSSLKCLSNVDNRPAWVRWGNSGLCDIEHTE